MDSNTTITEGNLMYMVHHIFLPPKLPQKDDTDSGNLYILCDTVRRCIGLYQNALAFDERQRWVAMEKAVELLALTQQYVELPQPQIMDAIGTMKTGDVLAFLIRAQNAGLILRKHEDRLVFESFEVSPSNAEVLAAGGKLLCTYPGPAIAVPNETASRHDFRQEFVSFITQMDVDIFSDAAPTTTKAKTTVQEIRDTTHPRYITELLTGILRGLGRPEETHRIQKRIADDVLYHEALLPWRRSPLWLVIRVALQTSLRDPSTGHIQYKSFMIFLMATILRFAISPGASVPSDLISCMHKKVARRLYKLRSVCPGFVLNLVHESGEAAQELLQKRWAVVQRKQESLAPWDPNGLDFPADTHLSLLNSKPYISLVLEGRTSSAVPFEFRPDPQARMRSIDQLSDISLISFFEHNPIIALGDFEHAVESGIDGWVGNNLHSEAACTSVARWVTEYLKSARSAYDSDPELWSVMLLTIFELWKALDQLAVAQCPLLGEYSPEVSEPLLEPLLVSKAEQIDQLSRLIRYLRARHSRAVARTSILDSSRGVLSFNVQYFQASPRHQQLKARIEQDGLSRRQAKVQELDKLNHRHRSLTTESDSLSHRYKRKNGREIHKKNKCQKCSLTAQASALKIQVHEWPLPEDEQQAQSVVVELDCPVPYRIWRDTTYAILNDVCVPPETRSKPSSKAEVKVILADYPSLQAFFWQYGTRRVMLASNTKSFQRSHYKTVSIPATEASVCTNHGLHWSLFDNIAHTWIECPFADCSTRRRCTFQLPSMSPYANLQYAVDGTEHTSNNVLADQTSCHRDVSLHEYVAFGGLRSGHRLQWLNLLRELHAQSFTLHREEVQMLMFQLTRQIGPLSRGDSGSLGWQWHEELDHTDFAMTLLEELERGVTVISANWTEVTSMQTALAIASRILVSTSSSHVIDKVTRLLRRARDITAIWMRKLQQAIEVTVDGDVVRALQLRLCEVACVCRSTYDVGRGNMPKVMTSNEDVSLLLECRIVIHDNLPSDIGKTPARFRNMLNSDTRLSLAAEPLLSEVVLQDFTGLHQAAKAFWPGYVPGTPWKALPRTDTAHWFTTICGSEGRVASTVHLNILTGQLLINGKPSSRLPREFVEHPTYRRIFGQKVLDVLPSDVPGLQFMTRGKAFGYQVFFALNRNENLLVVQACHGDEDLELIPHTHFEGDLPYFLVHEYVHWLDKQNHRIELRPLKMLWTSSATNWSIQLGAGGSSYTRMLRVQAGRQVCLIDSRSPTFGRIASCLQPLEDRKYLTVTFTPAPSESMLQVDLPRYRLSFALNSNRELECQSFPGMVVDRNQSTGTMFGLVNQLVLRPARTTDESIADVLARRCVLVPFGEVAHHVEGLRRVIKIDTHSERSVRYMKYEVDADLGRLVSNASLTSRLYKVYLHALTGDCLPDPLTGCTGTEEALYDLGSASCRSFQGLSIEDIKILDDIERITPRRTYYPSHLKVMQTVVWSYLPPTAQHYAFEIYSRDIKQYAESLGIFGEEQRPTERAARDCAGMQDERHLTERSAWHDKVFASPYCDGHHLPRAEQFGDASYPSRHDVSDHEREAQVQYVAKLVDSWSHWPSFSVDLWNVLKGWRTISATRQVGESLSYCREWMETELGKTWMALYELCRQTRDSKFQLAFTLPALVYGPQRHSAKDLVPILLVIAGTGRFRNLNPPSFPPSQYDLAAGLKPKKDQLTTVARSCTIQFEASPASRLSANPGESRSDLNYRRRSRYGDLCQTELSQASEALVSQWPCQQLSRPTQHFQVIDKQALVDRASPLFSSWYHNVALRDHIAEVQAVLTDLKTVAHGSPSVSSSYQVPPFVDLPGSSPDSSSVTFTCLFSLSPPSSSVGYTVPALPIEIGPPGDEASQRKGLVRLENLVRDLRARTEAIFWRKYANDLGKSMNVLSHQKPAMRKCLQTPNPALCAINYFSACRLQVDHIFMRICRELQPDAGTTTAELIMLRAGLWPRVTRKICLRYLTQKLRDTVSDKWRALFTEFARDLLKYQWSQRLLRSIVLGQSEQTLAELQNEEDGSQTCDLDWLLIQIDCNFLARGVQVRVAQEMIRPSSGSNAVSQLNMGEGKSSVIIPFAASTLADRTKLVRVFVLKSLSKQMFQLLVERLTGLANRQIFYAPFSRSMTISATNVEQIQNLYQQCMKSGGILLAQPEHILSFKLMSVERSLSVAGQNEPGAGPRLLETQRWCEANARDILDESDEILQVRYQLIYTMGQQEALEHAPERWTTIQQVLFLVRKVALRLRNDLACGLEVGESCNGCFPTLRVVDMQAGTRLVGEVMGYVSKGALPNCPLALLPDHLRGPTSCFIADKDMSVADYERVRQYWEGSNSWKTLLLLRGLFAHQILPYVLKERRWRVDYGLDLSRSLLAVPFKAKDVPSPRAEFGHPDVAILLTCLSYYYQGLSPESLEVCFELLSKLDNPTLEYELWVREGGPAIPEELRKLSGINPSDMEQRARLVIPTFRQNHVVVDFYLSQVVFPKAAKGFPHKLGTSGWDIARDRDPAHATTGFSGTNDNRYLLPATIAQRDTRESLGTNAEVLCNLLRPENDEYLCPDTLNGQPLSAQGLIELVARNAEVKVLLDVGAQILELANDQVARRWLEHRTDVAAAVFFNDADEIEVMTQDGVRELFLSSPFSSQLEKCVVYLDDAHTRGTDLRLPSGFRAAVTLGPKVTKDRLVQGCMRMRKLGRDGGHSIMFVAPREVDSKIRGVAGKSASERVSAADVIRWAMIETCMNIQHHVPHWVQQGVDYYTREQAWQKYHSLRGPSTSLLADAWLQVEAQSLESMYGSVHGEGASVSLMARGSVIPEIRERCEMLGVAFLHDPHVEEEQEREVSHEMEREWQVQRPAKAKPASHKLHPSVTHFIRSGEVVSPSVAFDGAFGRINEAVPSLSKHAGKLLATTDFHVTTTGDSVTQLSGDYLRPIHWVVSSKNQRILVIMSPYEVNELLPEIRKSKKVHLHIYAPRVTQAMKSRDDLRFYCIPPLSASWQSPEAIVIAQLNLVGGQLYLNDYDAYQLLCAFLGLCTPEVRDRGGVTIQSDGFIRPEDRPGNFYSVSPFRESPLIYLKALISFRRKGMTWLPTHMGKMFHGRFLTHEDFE
ncbi:hypothetical protein OE88DRAFT_1649890 [Heliocybe sulcata]|uniref:ubiquitinyl hydrolase 1 n=1 Tax=Heliocybe sulcata TaxID=5364 RepID=A0A5C3NGQ4_9AGAM|nr:hypothetical protein OE88DRAFT_1649890 [Heliocybe sulcata]